MCRRVGHIVTDVNDHRDTAMLMCRCVGHIVTDVNNHRDTAMLMCRRVGHIVTDVNNHRDTAMLICRRVGHIVTDVNNHRDTAMLMCRRVGYIVTDVNNHRDTAMRMCRRVGNIVTDGNNHRDTAIRPPCFFNVYFSISYSAGEGASISMCVVCRHAFGSMVYLFNQQTVIPFVTDYKLIGNLPLRKIHGYPWSGSRIGIYDPESNSRTLTFSMFSSLDV